MANSQRWDEGVGESPRDGRGGAGRVGRVGPEALVFAVAFVARLCMVLTSGGLGGTFGYDASVYYAAADALGFGRLPYRDFVLLHPPGLMLALTPVAWLGRVTSDHVGFMSGDVAFMVLGAINAVLVVRVAGKIGLPRRAAVLGGLFYAVWLGSVGAEFLIRLEPAGNFLVLCGLLAVFSVRERSYRGPAVVAGLAFGAAASVKIWWTVAVLVALGWHIVPSRRRALPWLALGATAALVLVNGPFFLAAPAAMWQMVVVEQLGRNVIHRSPVYRLRSLTGVHWLDPHLGAVVATGLAVAALALFVAVAVRAWRVARARLVVVLLVAEAAVLGLAPSWFNFYADYLAPAAAVCVAAALVPASVGRRGSWARAARAAPWATTALALLITAAFLAGPGNRSARSFPSAPLAAAVRNSRCVMSDSPMGLILLDSLSRDFRDGCRDWVDVTGRTYGVDAAASADGRPEPRRDNARWHHDLLAYLRSGNAAIIVRRSGSGITAGMVAALRRGGVLARADRAVVYMTAHRPAPPRRAIRVR